MILFFLLALQTQPPPPRAVIRGTVTAGDTGAPLKNAQVSVNPTKRGRAIVAITDAAGQYEIKNIPAGDYESYAAKLGFLTATYKTTLTLTDSREASDVNFSLQRGGVIAGMVTDDYGDPLPDVRVEAVWKNYFAGRIDLNLLGGSITDDRGRFRIHDLGPGRYYLRAFKDPSGDSSRDTPAPRYRAVFYPNAFHVADARAIRLSPGEELGGIALVMHETPIVSVHGKLVDERTGRPMGGVSLDALPELDGGSRNRTSVRPDGTFRLAWLTPGRYVVMVSGLFGSKYLDVPDHNVAGVTISVGPGATIKGTIEAGGGKLPSKMEVRMRRLDRPAYSSNEISGPVAPDGSFELPNLPAGNYALSVHATGRSDEPYLPFYTSSVTVNGRDTTDSIVVPEGIHTMEVRARIDFHPGSISGRTLAADGTPLAHATVVMVAADPKKRSDMRYFDDNQSGEAGAYEINGVAPGDYLLLIWPVKDQGEMILDPEIMALVEKYCVQVSVAASGKITRELRMIPEVQKIALEFSQH